MRNTARFALTVLSLVARDAGASGMVATTPEACAKCWYREPDMRDGGWCYMFREAPRPTCAQFKRSAPTGGPK